MMVMTVVVPPPPGMPPAPVHLIDPLVEVGSVVNGTAVDGRGQARRGTDQAYAQSDQQGQEHCTHYRLSLVPGGADRAPAMLWRSATA
jgi:hypothetical protein